MQEKTIGEWLKELPPAYYKAAIDNIVLQSDNPVDVADFLAICVPEVASVEMALKGSFNFKKSTEGLGYWSDVLDQLKAGTLI
jgi:hypothetical protein